MTTLDRLVAGARARVLGLTGDAALVQRFGELGLLEGDMIEVLAIAPLGDPMEIRCGQSRLSLRKSEAAEIHVAAD